MPGIWASQPLFFVAEHDLEGIMGPPPRLADIASRCPPLTKALKKLARASVIMDSLNLDDGSEAARIK